MLNSFARHNKKTKMILKILLFFSTCTLGIFLGSQLAEAALIVPYWKDLPSDDFFALSKKYGEKVYDFYAPLTILAVIFPSSTFFYSLLSNSKTDVYMCLMFIFTLAFFSMYYIYFKGANTAFYERTVSNEALSFELIKWGNWHWARVCCEVGAFMSSLILLLKQK